jgi:hypothetical protein
MLAHAENVLIAQLKDHRDIKRLVRTTGTLPKVPTDKLLQRYYADAPALYIVPGRFVVKDSLATMIFTVAGVVRNVAGQEQARKGDGIDIGCDHLVTLAIRAINGQFIGDCTWSVTGGEMADDELFDAAGIAAVEITLESTPVELDYNYGEAQIANLPPLPDSELADFTHFYADIDLPPHAGAPAHADWLAEPPIYTDSQPDATLDIQLPGAS